MVDEIFGYGFCAMIIAILVLISNWIIFLKAGRPGWQSLIPLYNIYVEYKLCWKGRYGLLSIALTVVSLLLVAFDADPLLISITSAASMLLQIIFCFKFSKAFGNGMFMGIILILSAGLGRIILGFGGSRYVRTA